MVINIYKCITLEAIIHLGGRVILDNHTFIHLTTNNSVIASEVMRKRSQRID